jgi:Fur family transcriptional regulator, ferric uptake regulator
MATITKWLSDRAVGRLDLAPMTTDRHDDHDHHNKEPAVTPASGRSTRQKRALALVVDEARDFRSAQELHEALRARGERVGLTTVYNQLRALADAGLLDTLRSADGETLYRRCGSEGHHHHLLCRNCGRTVEVAGIAIERWAEKVAAQAGFVDVSHTIEVVGTCPTCAAAT